MILDIWEQGYGVTTLHVYHSVIPVEAYTREACMIEAMSKCETKREWSILLISIIWTRYSNFAISNFFRIQIQLSSMIALNMIIIHLINRRISKEKWNLQRLFYLTINF